MCLRGISALTAFGLAVEIGDRTRFMVHQDDSGCRGASSAHFSGVDSGVDLQALLRRLLFLPLQCFSSDGLQTDASSGIGIDLHRCARKIGTHR
jgi:hypothetical protein